MVETVEQKVWIPAGQRRKEKRLRNAQPTGAERERLCSVFPLPKILLLSIQR